MNTHGFFQRIFLCLLICVSAFCPAAAAAELTIIDSWYDIYGIVYQGYDQGRKPGEQFNVVRGGETIGTFRLFTVEAGASKGKFAPSGKITSLKKGDKLEAPAEDGKSEADEVKKHIELGMSHLNKQQTNSAIQEFKLAIKKDPNNAHAHELLAEAYLLIPDEAGAEREREMAKRIRSNPAAPAKSLPKALKTEKPPKTAPASKAEAAGGSKPAPAPAAPAPAAPAPKSRAPKKLKQEMPTAPLPVPERSADFGKRMEAIMAQLRQLSESGETAGGAEKPASWFVNVEPAAVESAPPPPDAEEPRVEPTDFSEVYSNFGFMRFESGNYKEACDFFDKAIRQKPDNGSFHRNKAVALARMKLFDDALAEAETALKLGDPKAANLVELIKSLKSK